MHHLPNSGIQQTCPKLIFHQALWPYHVDNEATFHQTIANALGLSTSSRTELVWLHHASYAATTGAPYVHHARAHCPTHHVLWSFCRSSVFHLPTMHQNVWRLYNIQVPFIAVRVIANCTVLVHFTPMPTSSSFCLYHTSSLAAIKSFHQSSARVRSRFSLYVVLILCMLGCVYCLCQSMVCFKCVACESLVIAST